METYSSLRSRISLSAVRRIWTSSVEPPAGSAVAAAAGQLGQRVEPRRQRLAYRGRLGAELAQHRRDDATVLLEQHGEQVLGGRLWVAALVGQPLGGLQRLLGLDGETVWLHRRFRVSEGEI